MQADNDMFGTTCIDCGKVIDDSRPYVATVDGDLIHEGCGDPPVPMSMETAEQIHNLARGSDPDHDQSPCWCCCMDCDIDPVKDVW